MSMVTKKAPDFTAEAVLANGDVAPITLSQFQGKQYVLLFFYPKDFSPVCPLELIAFNRAADVFAKLNVQLLGISVDSIQSHKDWRNKPANEGGIGPVAYPMISDADRAITKKFDLLYNNELSLRGWFLIDKAGVVRHETVNDLPLVRSVDEALRMVETLQTFENLGEICPVNFTRK